MGGSLGGLCFPYDSAFALFAASYVNMRGAKLLLYENAIHDQFPDNIILRLCFACEVIYMPQQLHLPYLLLWSTL